MCEACFKEYTTIWWKSHQVVPTPPEPPIEGYRAIGETEGKLENWLDTEDER